MKSILYNMAEVGRYLGISRQRVYQLVVAGKIKASIRTAGNRKLFTLEDFAHLKTKKRQR